MRLEIGKSMVNLISGEMIPWVKKAFDEYGIGKGWKWPSLTHLITSPFGNRKSPGGIGTTNHSGIDIGAAFGTPVLASKGGTVTRAGWAGGYGNLVQIDHGNGWSTLYGHNSAILVSAGQRVRQGQTIALVGSTGRSTGPHIHFGMQHNGSFVNPLSYLGTGYENGGLVTEPGYIGERGRNEMVIPMSQSKRNRGLSLWSEAGEMLGITPRSPESSTTISKSNNTENNTYAPVFNLTVSGNNDDRTMERKVKRWIKESMDEVFSSLDCKNRRLREV